MLKYPNTEIIVVDDGSTDNTQEILKSFTGVKNIYQKNRGFLRLEILASPIALVSF